MMDRAARVRVTPEDMTKMLGLPEGNHVMRFLTMPYGVECFVGGDAMPKVEAGEPVLMDCMELDALMKEPAHVEMLDAARKPVDDDVLVLKEHSDPVKPVDPFKLPDDV